MPAPRAANMPRMTGHVIVAGGGIGGMACALALARSGQAVTLLEQAEAFGEVGAGLQLGPNAVKVLHDWGLGAALRAVAAFPDALHVRDAASGDRLGLLPLGTRAQALYGHPYATLHRADLHRLLLTAVSPQSTVVLRQGQRLEAVEPAADGVRARLAGGEALRGDALVACDGLWSVVRAQLWGDGPPPPTGHLAYRGMVRIRDLPERLRDNGVTAWLAPQRHLVHYPVRGGDWVNVVAVVHGQLGAGADARSWQQAVDTPRVRKALDPLCADLQTVIEAVPAWTLWQLHDRAPISDAAQMARGRVALLGDAAHPMRPYLAQGAAMALEDAWTLGLLVHDAAGQTSDWPSLLSRYADLRWARAARVQARSRRNGRVFHAEGGLRWARNAAMGLLGPRLLDNPWLYGGPARPPRPPSI